MTAPQPDQQRAAVIAVYQQQTTQLRNAVTAYVTAFWKSLGTYRASQMAQFTAQIVPVIEGAMQQMQALTGAYLATLSSLGGGSSVPIAGSTLTVGSVRNGADPAEVYSRPFHLVWRQLDSLPRVPGSVEAAIKSGLDRAVQTATTDVQLAKTHTSQAVLKQSTNITGYRRQLEGPRSCGLCIVAATRRYQKAELMPMHPACDCSVVPLHGTEAANAVLDPTQLATVHDVVAQQFGADSTAARQITAAFTNNGKPLLYRDVLIEHHHGELGPILAVRGQHFVGPGDIAA